MKKMTSFFRKRSLEDQPSPEPLSKQPMINQQDDSDETSEAGHTGDSSSSFNSRSATSTIIRKL